MKRVSASVWMILSAAMIALAPMVSSGAAAETLSGSALHSMFAGRTVYLSAPFGSLPIRYSPGGTMVAQSRLMQAFSGYYQDTGTWRITSSQFCQRWKTWLKGKEQCFTVRQKGDTLHWTSNDGMSGTASVAQ